MASKSKKIKNFNQLKTPKGSQDVLPILAYRQEEQRSRLLRLFASRGYNQIITPTLEKLESIIEAYGEERQNELFKLVDNSGQVLVLRPDVTIPIARVVASRYADNDTPLKIGYFTNIFRWDYHSISHKEVYQAGVELIGSDGIMADIEVLSVLGDSIAELGINPKSPYKLTLVVNDTNITDKILKGYSEDARYAFCHNDYAYLRENYPELNDLAKLIGSPDKIISKLASTLGKSSVQYISNIFEIISKNYPYVDFVFDVTMRPDGNYYSGIVFDLMIDNTVVAQGGRYDKLLQAYGAVRPAIGFAIYIDRFNRAVSHNPPHKEDDANTIMTIYYTPDSLGIAHTEMRNSWKKGYTVNTVSLEKLEDIDRHAEYDGLFMLCSGDKVILIRENINIEDELL